MVEQSTLFGFAPKDIRGPNARNIIPLTIKFPAPFSPILGRNDRTQKIAAPATTFKFISKEDTPPAIATENPQKHGFPPGKHWVDYAGDFAAADPEKAGSIMVIEQPGHQYCAVTGGIMATRMKALGLKGAVIGGRIRDLRELQATGLPVRLDLFMPTEYGIIRLILYLDIDLGSFNIYCGHKC